MPTRASVENGEPPRYTRGSTPVPDPTVLTTQQLVREIAALREIVDARLDGMDKASVLLDEQVQRIPGFLDQHIDHLKELHGTRFEQAHESVARVHDVLNSRIEGMDKAIVLLQNIADRIMGRVDEKIESLHNVHDEKFASIQTQFRERDVRTEQSSKDSKVAVDAALQAAKEAVAEQNKSSALAIAKSETSTTKQIDQMGLQIQSGTNAMDGKVNDLKERVTRIEGMGEGKHASTAFMFSIVAALVSVLSLITVLVLALRK
jgi:hypothetical protein